MIHIGKIKLQTIQRSLQKVKHQFYVKQMNLTGYGRVTTEY